MAHYPDAVRELRECLGLVRSVDVTGKLVGVVESVFSRLGGLEEVTARAVLVEAFELCLGATGAVPWSLPLWRAYQSFIESWPLSFGDDVAASMRSSHLARLLERGVALPIQDVEALARDYELLGGSPPTLDGATERVAAWQAAVAASDGVAAWRGVIEFEVRSSAHNREAWVWCVTSAYRAAIQYTAPAPAELWHEFAQFCLRRRGEATLSAPAPAGKVAAAHLYRLASATTPAAKLCISAAWIAGEVESGREAALEALRALSTPAAAAVAIPWSTVLEPPLAHSEPMVWQAHAVMQWLVKADTAEARCAFQRCAIRRSFRDVAQHVLALAVFLELVLKDTMMADLLFLRFLRDDNELFSHQGDEGAISVAGARADDETWKMLARAARAVKHPLAPIVCKVLLDESTKQFGDGDTFHDPTAVLWRSIILAIDWSKLDIVSWWPHLVKPYLDNFMIFRNGVRLRPSFLDTILDADPLYDVTKRSQDQVLTTKLKVGLVVPSSRGGPHAKQHAVDSTPLPRALAHFVDKLPYAKLILRPGYGYRDRVEFVLDALSRLPLEQITNLRDTSSRVDPDDDDVHTNGRTFPPDIFKRRRKAQLDAARRSAQS